MSENIYLITLSLFFGTIVLVFALKYLSSLFSGRSAAAEREKYRKLAEESTAVNEQLTRDIAALRQELTDISERTAEIQRVLRQVE